MQKAAVQERVHELESLCREQGVPLTVQRRVVFESLVQVDTHPTADGVFAAVKGRIPGISRTTVYRVLEALARVGVIQRIPHPMSAARYDGDPRRHHHLVCRSCGQVYDVHDERLDDVPLPAGRVQGFRVEDYSIVFTGLCSSCRSPL